MVEPDFLPVVKNPVLRSLLVALGAASLVLGIAGIFLPVLPTTPFILLTGWCFAKSSPRFHTWLINHRFFGPMIRDWRERGAIPRKAKWLALAMISVSLVSIWWGVPRVPIQIGCSLLLVCVVVFLFTRPDA